MILITVLNWIIGILLFLYFILVVLVLIALYRILKMECDADGG